MSEKIDNVRVVPGRLIRVKNTQKKKFSHCGDEYVAVWVEDANGQNERCLLFTDRELNVAQKRAAKNPEDLTKKGFVQNLID